MKKLLTIILLLFASTAVADTWCHWDGAIGDYCKDDTKGYILIDGRPIKTPAKANASGYYHVTFSETITAEVEWTLDGTELTRTRTQEEIDLETAEPMDIGQYYLWKALIAKGVITQQEAAAALPQELIDAYQARQDLNQ